MDEVAKLERQKRKNYPLIKEKLFKAGTLGNFSALVKTAWLFGNQDAAREYGVPFHPLKACILSVYTNNRYGDLNKDAMDLMLGSPGRVDTKQLDELGIEVKAKED